MGIANETRQHGTRSALDGLDIEVAGEGRPVLLLHGNSENHGYFAAQIPVLARHRRVLAPDARAHGESARGDGPLTIARLGQDAANIIERFAGPDPAHPVPCDVIGFSDGANVAIELTLQRPDLVRSLVLNAGNLYPSGLNLGALREMRASYAALRWAARFSSAARARQEVWSLMVEEPQFSPEDLAAISVPTLVLVGERDIIRWEHSKLIAESIPGARIIRVPGAGHNLLETMPEVANPILVEFLNTVDLG